MYSLRLVNISEEGETKMQNEFLGNHYEVIYPRNGLIPFEGEDKRNPEEKVRVVAGNTEYPIHHNANAYIVSSTGDTYEVLNRAK